MSGRDFWTRRRAAVEAEAAAQDAAVAAQRRAEEDAALEAKSDEEILADRNLPAPEALETPEDIRAFLSEALPQRLKTRALRRLWRLNPVLANLDGLVDYGQDFTDSATVIENLQTAYQVGKGMLAHVEKMAEAAEAREKITQLDADEDDQRVDTARPNSTQTDIDASESLANIDQVAPEAEVQRHSTASDPHDRISTEETAAATPSRHRMRFQFEMQT